MVIRRVVFIYCLCIDSRKDDNESDSIIRILRDSDAIVMFNIPEKLMFFKRIEYVKTWEIIDLSLTIDLMMG